MPGKLTIGTAPDSWGVWFPSDPEQVSADVFLREVVEAGYEAIELGPYGYLPKDPAELKDTLDAHGLRVLAGTVFSHLHQPDSWDYTWKQVTDVAALTQAVGGEHIVVIPDTYTDQKSGAVLESLGPQRGAVGPPDPPERRARPADPRRTTGCSVQFHPHADTHVGYQPEIERFLECDEPRVREPLPGHRPHRLLRG